MHSTGLKTLGIYLFNNGFSGSHVVFCGESCLVVISACQLYFTNLTEAILLAQGEILFCKKYIHSASYSHFSTFKSNVIHTLLRALLF